MMHLAMHAARILLSVLVTQGAGVRDEPGEFFGEEEEETVVETVRPWRIAFRTPQRTVAAKSETARQAAKEMPSGPAAEFLESLVALATS